MSKGSSMEANIPMQQDLRSVSFPKACRTSGKAQAFLEPVIEEYTANLRACIDRLKVHQEALRIPRFEAPELKVNILERSEDLSELPDPTRLEFLSLDIFDTCVVRSLERPENIFELLGGQVESQTGLKAQDFAADRKAIEQQLRQQGLERDEREDTSLKAIYHNLADKFSWNPSLAGTIMEKEISLERFFLHPVEPIRDYAWKVHDLGIPLVYTSEMYLSEDILRIILNETGFPTKGIPLYSSGEYGLSKGTGNLYRTALQDVGEKKIFHIGDNPISDGEVPHGLGIETAIITTNKKVYPDLLSNVLHSVSLSRTNTEDLGFWEDFGCRVAGPLHFAFAAHLYGQCRAHGFTDLFFLSRDGWFPQKVFRKLQETWGRVTKDHYVYASREFFGIGGMSDIGPEEWDFLLKPSPLLKTGDVFERIGIPEEVYLKEIHESGLPDKDDRICHHWGFKDPTIRDRLYTSLCRCLPHFLEYRNAVQESLVAYLEATGIFSGTSAFVDLGWNGSSARSLEKLAPSPGLSPAGIYFALLQPGTEKISAYFTTGGCRMDLLKGSIALMEFIFGSPEPTAKSVELISGAFAPLFRKAWQAHEIEAWNTMETGINRYTEDCLGILARPPDGDGSAYLETILREFLFQPGLEELKHMGGLSHSEGWGTDNRLRILPKPGTISSEEQLREALCYCPWKSGLQSQLQVAISSAQL